MQIAVAGTGYVDFYGNDPKVYTLAEGFLPFCISVLKKKDVLILIMGATEAEAVIV